MQIAHAVLQSYTTATPLDGTGSQTLVKVQSVVMQKQSVDVREWVYSVEITRGGHRPLRRAVKTAGCPASSAWGYDLLTCLARSCQALLSQVLHSAFTA